MTRSWLRFLALPLWGRLVLCALAWPVPLSLWAASRPRRRRTGPLLLAAASTVLWAAVPLSAFREPERKTDGEVVARGSVPTRPAEPGGSPSTTSRPQAPAPTAPAEGDPALVLIGLRVAPEGPRAGYRRELFHHWSDADGDRCNTREEVLIAESRHPAQVDPYGCTVVAGDWFSLYDGLTFTDPSELDIDHVVPLAEAWDSGASAWDAARREAFANDLDRPQALRAVSAWSNRSKGDLDPGQWKPTREAAWCEYARDWVTVKKAWDLSADPGEVDDLRLMLRTCQGSAAAGGTGARAPG